MNSRDYADANNNYNHSTIQELITDPSIINQQDFERKDMIKLLNKTKEERDVNIVDEMMNSNLIKNSSQIVINKSSNLDASNYSYNKVNSKDEDDLKFKKMKSDYTCHSNDNRVNDLMTSQKIIPNSGALGTSLNEMGLNSSKVNNKMSLDNSLDDTKVVKKKKRVSRVAFNNDIDEKNYNQREEINKGSLRESKVDSKTGSNNNIGRVSLTKVNSQIFINKSPVTSNANSTNKIIKISKNNSSSMINNNISSSIFQQSGTIHNQNTIPDLDEILNHNQKDIETKGIIQINTGILDNRNLGEAGTHSRFPSRRGTSNIHINNFIDKMRTKSMIERLERRRDSRKRNSEVNTVAMNHLLKQAEVNTIYGKTLSALKWIDVFISILLTVDILISVLDNELYINYTDEYFSEQKNITLNNPEDFEYMEKRDLFPIENILRILNGILSFASFILIIFRYKKKVVLNQIDRKLSKYDNIWTSGMFWYMVIDCIIAIIFYPPFINKITTGRMLGLIYAYNLNSIFSVVVMVKLYLILRVTQHFSRWTTDTAVAVCNNYKVKSGAHFAIKAEMRKRPATILSLLLIVSLSLLAFSLRTFEYGVIDPDNGLEGVKGTNDLQNLANCFWLIIVTMTTVGFGDFYPRSHLGRLVGVFACIIGMLLLSLIVVSLGSISEFSPEEKKAYSKLKKLFADDNLENKAANVIRNVIFLRKLVNNFGVSRSTLTNQIYQNPLMERFVYLTQLKKEISIFKNDYKISNSFSLHVDEMLKRLEDKLKDDITKLTNILKKINGLDVDLDSLAKDQQEVQDSLVDIIKMQDDISKYMVNINNESYMKNLLKKKKIEEEMRLRKEREVVPGIVIEKSPRRADSNIKIQKSHRSNRPDGEGNQIKRRKSKRSSTKKMGEDFKTANSLYKKSNRLCVDMVIPNAPMSKRSSTAKSNMTDEKKDKNKKVLKFGKNLTSIAESGPNEKEIMILETSNIDIPIPTVNNNHNSTVKLNEETAMKNEKLHTNDFYRANTIDISKLNENKSLLGFDSNYKIEMNSPLEEIEDLPKQSVSTFPNPNPDNNKKLKTNVTYSFKIIMPSDSEEPSLRADDK